MTETNPLAGFLADLDTEEKDARLAAIAEIKHFDSERANEKTAEIEKDKAGLVLRNFFLTHPDDKELVDSEWGLRAYMQKGDRSTWYDPAWEIKQANPRLYARLEELRLLTVDHKAVKLALANGSLTHGDIAGYVHEGEGSPKLQVRPAE